MFVDLIDLVLAVIVISIFIHLIVGCCLHVTGYFQATSGIFVSNMIDNESTLILRQWIEY